MLNILNFLNTIFNLLFDIPDFIMPPSAVFSAVTSWGDFVFDPSNQVSYKFFGFITQALSDPVTLANLFVWFFVFYIAIRVCLILPVRWFRSLLKKCRIFSN